MVDAKKVEDTNDGRTALGRSTPRLLGAMFLIVIVIGLASGSFLSPVAYSMTGPPEDISETMESFADNPSLVRASIIGYLFEATSVVALAVMLFVVLRDQDQELARWAYGLWIIEAAFVVVRQVFVFSLLYTSQDFVAAGSPVDSHFQTLGGLFYALIHFSGQAQMVFYCVGGIVAYYLFYRSGIVPKALAAYGIAVASLGLVGEVVAILGTTVPLWVFLPILPFELGIGVWLVVKGINPPSE